MGLVQHISRMCVAILFTILGANAVFSVPFSASELTFFQSETTHITQEDDVGFAARAPPLAAANVEVTGGVTVMQGSAFALHGQETVAALFGFDVGLNAPNTGAKTVGHAENAQTLISHNASPVRQGTVIKGGHNEQSFNALAASDPNINVGTATQVAPGIRSVEYTVTKADGSISSVRTKTVSDPSVYSDQQIANMSSTAISQAPTPTAGSNLSTTNVNGLEFTVTRDPTGSVNNVFVSGAN